MKLIRRFHIIYLTLIIAFWNWRLKKQLKKNAKLFWQNRDLRSELQKLETGIK